MYTRPAKKGPRTNKPAFEGKMRLRVGDLVRVIVGKDKGKEGKITQVSPRDGKVVIEGINIVIKHEKPRQQPQQTGMVPAAPQAGRIEKAAPIPASKVQLVDPSDNGRVTRIGVKVDSDGNRVRIARKSGSVIENGD